MPTIKLRQPHHPPETKTCYKCGKRLPLSGFVKRKDMRDGCSSECRLCTNQRKLREKAARESRARNIEEGNVRVCTKCHKTLPIDDFDTDAEMCRLCVKRYPPLTEKDYLNRYLTKKRRRR